MAYIRFRKANRKLFRLCSFSFQESYFLLTCHQLAKIYKVTSGILMPDILIIFLFLYLSISIYTDFFGLNSIFHALAYSSQLSKRISNCVVVQPNSSMLSQYDTTDTYYSHQVSHQCFWLNHWLSFHL